MYGPQNNNFMIPQLHINDRKIAAGQLGLSVERFDWLLKSANHAHEFIMAMGPFYGKEEIKEPTFRITAEPVQLPAGAKEQLRSLGNDLLYLGRALPKLPAEIKAKMGTNLDFRVPLSWRVDCIINEKNEIKMNEVEGKDGASALMVIEQLAYNLQSANQTTAGRFIGALNKMFSASAENRPIKIAFLRTDIKTDHYALNTRRFIELVHELSQNGIQCELFDLNEAKSFPDWMQFHAVFNESLLSPAELKALDIPTHNLFAAGNYDALATKIVFALIHEHGLTQFWKTNIGVERLQRLRKIMIPTHFIGTEKDIAAAREEAKVVKVAWAHDDLMLINRSNGVAVPVEGLKQGDNQRWENIYTWFKKGYTLIAQDYVQPMKIPAFLRKKGTNLEAVSWYNRLCVKYVVDGDANGEFIPQVFLTAAEITLGPNVIPAGRECAFTAAAF